MILEYNILLFSFLFLAINLLVGILIAYIIDTTHTFLLELGEEMEKSNENKEKGWKRF